MKKYNLVIKQEAKDEITEAYNWYKNKQNELGERLISVLDDYFSTIKKNPKQFPKVLNDMRQATIKKFPYIIIFEIENNDIVVFAVFNTNQNPEKWKSKV